MIVDNSLILYYRGEGTTYHVDIFDLDNLSETYFAVKRFEYDSEVDVDNGSLVRLGSSVYIAPHNKMLNLIDGVWYLNDYVSTSPIVRTVDQLDVEDVENGVPARGHIVIASLDYQGVLDLHIGSGPVVNVDMSQHATVQALLDAIIDAFEAVPYYDERYLFSRGQVVENFAVFGDAEFEDIMPFNTMTIESRQLDDIGFREVVVTGHPQADVDVTLRSFNVSGGIAPETTGTLEQMRDYWYTARYRYSDGHVTRACYPVAVRTTNTRRRNRIEIKPVRDLDNRRFAEVEVYRSTRGSEFFLIDNVTPEQLNERGYFYYDDTGRLPRNRLDELMHIWTDEHQIHGVVRDRYVRGNLRYKNRPFALSGRVFTETTDDDRTIPPNVTMELYARGRFRNGMESEQVFVDSVDNKETDRQVAVNVDSLTGEDLKELAFYAKYDQFRRREGITVGSIDFHNVYIPSLATRNKSRENQFRPEQQYLFLGWKYVMRIAYLEQPGTGPINVEDYIVDSELDSGNEDNDLRYESKFMFRRQSGPFNLNERRFIFPDTETFEPVEGYPQEYDLVGFRPLWYTYLTQDDPYPPTFSSGTQPRVSLGEWGDLDTRIPVVGIYKLAMYDGFKRAATTGRVKIQLLDSGRISGDDGLVGKEITVIGIADETEGVPQFTQTDMNSFAYSQNEVVLPEHDDAVRGLALGTSSRWIYPTNSKLYIIVNDSELRDYTNTLIQNTEFLDDYEDLEGPLVGRQATFSYRILDLVLNPTFFLREDTQEGPVVERVSIGPRDEDYWDNVGELKTTVWESLRELAMFGHVIPEGDRTLIYLGRGFPDDQTITFERTGYTQVEERGLARWSLDTDNLYSTLVDVDETERMIEKYPQQLIVSMPFAPDGNLGGSRTFLFSGIYNVPDDHGVLVGMAYVQGRLFVFTTHGVAMVFVGEVVSEQASGNAVVDTARFLTDNQWVLRNLKKVQPRSIVTYEHMLFFSDGIDVWMRGQELQNISNGAVVLADGDHVGGIDVENKEYRISDGHQTWAYSLETREWSGPYTYSGKVGMLYRDRLYGVSNGHAVLHNRGNAFGVYPAYETEVQWAGNDFNESTIDKIFRKFYLDVDGPARFEYSKNRNTWFGRDIADYNKINGIVHAGVKQEYSNSQSLYWRFKTKAKEFALKGVSFIWYVRDRL